ncbi:MAG: MBOAT family protein [Bacteroidetes bacterium]|nr:MBOAT family protein [Bacteroidota bacterium]
MLFNSFNFLVFFPVVTGLYFLLPHRFRWFMLLAASCFFYMFFIPAYVLILIFTIIVDYFAGLLLGKEKNARRKKLWLIMSLVANIGVLAVFKYYNFFNTNFEELAHRLGWNYGIPMLKMVLPIGLSFHTFQAMSYTIEVFRGNQKAEKHFGIYALYVMYYPQLVAGPIERPQNMLWQFRVPQTFDYVRVTDGLKLMAWGLFKKVVIADRLSTLANPVFDHPQNYEGISMLVATIFFSFQIYCDFSGYSDIALGASQVMGIKLMKNFDRPYFSKSISEFWKRWHISLSSWFRDYLYIPLGGNQKGKFFTYRNLFLTFLISGFWHGANWTFIIWGALHGSYLIFAILTQGTRKKMRDLLGITKRKLLDKILQAAIVFSLVSFAWIFFRADSLAKAWYMISHIATGVPKYIYHFLTNRHFLWLEPITLKRDLHAIWFEYVVIFIAIALMESVHWLQRGRSGRELLRTKPVTVRWGFYIGLTWLILLFGVYHSKNEFIYFQF